MYLSEDTYGYLKGVVVGTDTESFVQRNAHPLQSSGQV